MLSIYDTIPRRNPNRKRKRDDFEKTLAELTEKEFKSQTGLSRLIFNYLLHLVEPILRRDERQATRSSGSPITTIMRLFIHQRLMKGAKTQDLMWIGIDPKHAWETCWRPTAHALDEVLNNVEFKSDDPDWLEEQALQWSFQQRRKYGFCLAPGLISAGDGLIIQIPCLSFDEFLKSGILKERFWNRKQFYALCAQAFCDSWCRFQYFDLRWPGAVPDMISYLSTELYVEIMKILDPKYYVALDEAYKSIHDGKHITPFSGSEITSAVDGGHTVAAQMMRTFNKIFCSDRITIERAFGQMSRKWPIMWSAIPRNTLEDITLVMKVLVKLHNLCVDEFLCIRFGYMDGVLVDGELKMYPSPSLPRTYGQFMSKMPNAWKRGSVSYDEEPFTNEDRPDLSEAFLLSNLQNLRTATRVQQQETDESGLRPQRAYTDNATLNAGIAMSNDMNMNGEFEVLPFLSDAQNETRRLDSIRIQNLDELHNFERLSEFINNQEENLQTDLLSNLSAARRLQFTVNMKKHGLQYGENISIREQGKT